jgi:uncharacterized protein YktB (UPF0637 family)
MATLGFLRRDFELLAIADFDTRLAKIDDLIRPRLIRLGNELAPGLSRKLRMELFAHVPRRTADHETCAAFGPSRTGYKRHGYLALCISSVGIHVRAIVKSAADQRAEIGQAIKSKSVELERSFHGTKIQQYLDWDCHKMPGSRAAGADFFEGLGDVLRQKSGSIDVGFGWPVRDALTIDRAEVVDAFRELEPLYRVIRLSS